MIVVDLKMTCDGKEYERTVRVPGAAEGNEFGELEHFVRMKLHEMYRDKLFAEGKRGVELRQY